MEPITLIIGGALVLLTVAATAYFWAQIAHWFQTKVIPWVKRTFGETWGGALGSLISWIDGKMPLLTKAVKGAVAFFKKAILGITSTYRKVSPTQASKTTKTTKQNPNGTFVVETSEQIVPWEDLPKEIRDRFIKENKTEGVMDDRAEFVKRVKEKAQQEGIALELEI